MKGLAIFAAGFFALSCVAAAAAVDSSLSPAANAAFLAANKNKPGVTVTTDGLQYRIIQSGFGKRPTPTDIVTVDYKGSLINGKVFDATEPELPAQFPANKLIPGWTEALLLMREGDNWELVIPPQLAYGDRGAGSVIPPGQTLVFDLHLISVAPAPPEPKQGDEDRSQ
ncbi:MAG TPA: FKBP-type peptidyl-prolyl cis-trans isomerase [Rhizomicrobium sp.]|jgi:FKBP-type peptidyl-prolyl cis-trans isomerase